MADIQPLGLSRGLTNYGDADFSLYLRRSFASSMGYSREMQVGQLSAFVIRRADSTIAIVMSLK